MEFRWLLTRAARASARPIGRLTSRQLRTLSVAAILVVCVLAVVELGLLGGRPVLLVGTVAVFCLPYLSAVLLLEIVERVAPRLSGAAQPNARVGLALALVGVQLLGQAWLFPVFQPPIPLIVLLPNAILALLGIIIGEHFLPRWLYAP